MSTTSDGASGLVQAYYEILGVFDADRLRSILAPNLLFEGPIAGHVVGAERFIKGVRGFVETKRSLTMLHQLYEGDSVATMYDAEMPGGTVRFAEFFEVDDGKIQSLRLMYDPADYRSKGGR